MVRKGYQEEDKTDVAETATVYYLVKHGYSYLSKVEEIKLLQRFAMFSL